MGEANKSADADAIADNILYHKMIDVVYPDRFEALDVDGLCSYQGHKGYLAEYFPTVNFKGEPCTEYVEHPSLKYRGRTHICGDINSSSFSVRYQTCFQPNKSGNYTFNLDTSKRFGLWINDSLVINAFEGKSKASGEYTLYCNKGQKYDIRMDVVMKGRHGELTFEIGTLKDRSPEQLAQSVADADVIIFVGGITPALEGEQNGVKALGFNDGDRTTIALPQIQTQLLKELKKLGKPIVLVLTTGSAIAIPWEAENIDAIVNSWYGGQAGGLAVADVLFGDYNPSGRLPFTVYASDSDLPEFTDYCMDGRTYRYFNGQPLYPFGYGLSYTDFDYSDLEVSEYPYTGESITVSVKVSNTGNMEGDEVVQLYLTHDPENTDNSILPTSNDAREWRLPIRSLKGFQRLSLKPGQTQSVEFTLSPEDLSICDASGNSIQLPEKVTLSVGGCQPGYERPTLTKTIEIAGPKQYVFD